jgi:ribosomal protein L37AE/L43A
MSRAAPQKKETPQELARVLEQERPCQTCRNPVARLFDGLYLCDACRRAAWKKIYREAYGC